MRKMVQDLLIAGLTDESPIPADRWYGSGSVEGTPPRPFAESRYGGTLPAIGGVTRRRLEVWIHDEEGDYGSIEDQLKYVKGILDGLEQVQDGQGNDIIRCTWLSDSTDLYDDGYKTNCMMSAFEIVGKEAS